MAAGRATKTRRPPTPAPGRKAAAPGRKGPGTTPGSSGRAAAAKAAGRKGVAAATSGRSRTAGKVSGAKAQPAAIPMQMLEHCAACLKVLAHPHRLKMVELLGHHRYTVGELAGELDLAPAAVSQHLSKMKACGLLGSEREGKEVYYNVANPQATNVIECIQKHMSES